MSGIEYSPGVTIEQANLADMRVIFDNMRVEDREELQAWGCDDWDTFSKLAPSRYGYIGKYHDEPVCCFGAFESCWTLHIWFFATPRISEFWITMHRFLRGFLPWVAGREIGMQLLVMKWLESDTLPWIERIGFRPTKHIFKIGQEKFRIYEYEVKQS